ncbi:MAG: methylated-DNA--[protein]-cysteine S-methyltransferase [Pseudomonadota bacterium]
MQKIINEITYGVHSTEIGDIVLGMTGDKLCWLGFMVSEQEGAYKGDGLTRMKKAFPRAKFIQDQKQTKQALTNVLEKWRAGKEKEVVLNLQGTDFQKSVWNHLLTIPKGKTQSYAEVANDIGKPKASRAVGSAVGNNPVSLIVPCHRVVQGSGGLGNYGWGLDLKKRLLELEEAI